MTSTNISSSRSRFTDADVAFPIWGLGKHACPGRHYASFLLKLVLAHVLLRYEIRLPDGTGSLKKGRFTGARLLCLGQGLFCIFGSGDRVVSEPSMEVYMALVWSTLKPTVGYGVAYILMTFINTVFSQ